MATATRVPSTTGSAATFARREKLRLIMRQAWAWARHGATKFGGSPRLYLAEALKLVWGEKKRLAREIAASRARVLAELAAMKEEGVIAPPLPVARYRTPPPARPRHGSRVTGGATMAYYTRRADELRRRGRQRAQHARHLT